MKYWSTCFTSKFGRENIKDVTFSKNILCSKKDIRISVKPFITLLLM